MFWQLLIAILLGLSAGCCTGLTPGIHINLVALLLLSSSAYLMQYFSLVSLASFIISMSITHSFLDSIPSIFLGAPDSATALGVLPGHRYLLKGYGLMAVKLTIIGSFFGLLLSVALFPVLIPFVSFIYPYLKGQIGYILVGVAVFMILRDNKKTWAILLFLLAGILGVVVLNMHILSNPLFPLLSGLFGVSTLFYSLSQNECIPEQKISQELKLDKSKTIQALLSGTFSGWLTSVLPGVGAATAAVLSMQITRKLGDHGFMVLMGSINTVNFALSLVTLYALGKTRNGSVIVVQQLVQEITISHIMIFVLTATIAGSIAVFLALKIGKFFSVFITKINYRKTVLGVIGLIVILTFVLTGILGFVVLIVATAVGLIPAIVKVTRTHAMACLLLPVMLYFLV